MNGDKIPLISYKSTHNRRYILSKSQILEILNLSKKMIVKTLIEMRILKLLRKRNLDKFLRLKEYLTRKEANLLVDIETLTFTISHLQIHNLILLNQNR